MNTEEEVREVYEEVAGGDEDDEDEEEREEWVEEGDEVVSDKRDL